MLRSLVCRSVRFAIVAACVGGLLSDASAFAGKKSSNKILRELTLDESAPVVELFDGVDAGQFQVRMSAKSPHEASVFIKNLTDEPLTVQLPKAAVGVHILPQFFGQGNNNNPFGNQNQGQNNNQMGRSQTIGGPLQPGGNQNGFPNQNNGNGQNPFMGNNGFFSIPPEQTVQLKMRTVCLDYGLPDPNVGDKYELRRLDAVVSNPALRELLENYSPRDNQDVVQAAAWHLANGLSWNQIANLPDNALAALAGGTKFSTATVKSAQALVKQREQSAKDREKAAPAPSVAPAKIVRTSAPK